MVEATTKAETRWVPFRLRALCVLSLATILLWPLVILVSVAAIDPARHGSSERAMLAFAYPLLPAIGVPVSFFRFRAGQKAAAYVAAAVGAIPLGLALPLIAMLIFGLILTYLPG